VHWTEPDGTARSERTDTPTRTVAELAARFGEDSGDGPGEDSGDGPGKGSGEGSGKGFGGEIPGLRVTRPTLEEIYLRLIGTEEA
jgi:ABC-2 type transport system ATP-binding protein